VGDAMTKPSKCYTCTYQEDWVKHQGMCSICYEYQGSGSGYGTKYYRESIAPPTVKLAEDLAEAYQKGDYYKYTYKDIKFDWYRIWDIMGITHGAEQQAIKKIARAGRGDKSIKQDLLEARDILDRRLEMLEEDNVTG
jgi:hypothetical protein